MYNGIGLQTARGSGTNGYVQANKFLVRHRQTKIERRDFADGQGQGGVLRKANKDILDHEKKRQIELKILMLQESLEEEGYDEEEIEKKVDELRQELEAANAEVVVEDAAFMAQETHQIAMRKEKKMEVFKNALGLENVREGEAFDRDLQEQKKLERIAEREAKKEEERILKEAEEKAKKDAEKAAKRKAKEEKKEKKRLARELERQKEREERRLRKEKKAAAKRAAEEEAERLALEAKKAEEAAKQLRGEDRWQLEDEPKNGRAGTDKRRRYDSEEEEVGERSGKARSGRKDDDEIARSKKGRGRKESKGRKEDARSAAKSGEKSRGRDERRKTGRYDSESESESELSSSESELSESDPESEREALRKKKRAAAPTAPINGKKVRHDSPSEIEPEGSRGKNTEERAVARPQVRSPEDLPKRGRSAERGRRADTPPRRKEASPVVSPERSVSPPPRREVERRPSPAVHPRVTRSPPPRRDRSLSRDIPPPPRRDIRRESGSPRRSVSPPPRRRLSPDRRGRSPPRRAASPYRGGRLRRESPPPPRGGRFRHDSPPGRGRRPSPFRARSPPRRRSPVPRGYDERRRGARDESPARGRNGREGGRRERSPPRRRSPSSSRSPAPLGRSPIAPAGDSPVVPSRRPKALSPDERDRSRSPGRAGKSVGEGAKKPPAKRAVSESSDSYSDSLSGSSSEDESPVRKRAAPEGARGRAAPDDLLHEGLEAAPGVPKGRPVSDSEEEARVKRVRRDEEEDQAAVERAVAPVVAAAKRRADSPPVRDVPERGVSKRQKPNESDLEDEERFERARGKGVPAKRPLSESESDDEPARKKGRPGAEAKSAKAAEKGDDLLKKVTKEAPKAQRASKRRASSESDYSNSGSGSSFSGSSYSDSESDSESERRPKKSARK